MRPAPDKMWNPDPQIAVVRLKLDDITIVDTGGRWMNVPTVEPSTTSAATPSM